MPGANQRSTTIPEKAYEILEDISVDSERSVAKLVTLLIQESFGKGEEQKKAHKILSEIRRQ